MARLAIHLAGHNSVYAIVFDERINSVVSSCGLDSYLDYYSGDPTETGSRNAAGAKPVT